MEKACVLGLGYIGLPTAVLAAEGGKQVLGVDINKELVHRINGGRYHFPEPQLAHSLDKVLTAGRLKAGHQIESASTYIITVPTPFVGDHSPDLSFVEKAISSIAEHVGPDQLIIIESTCPVGTTKEMASYLSNLRDDIEFVEMDSGWELQFNGGGNLFLAYCPERVIPGAIMRELVSNDRIIGGINATSAERAAEFYRGFVKGKLLMCDSETAEMVKLAENAYRDTNIAFANELSMMCHQAGIDPYHVVSLANCHPRVDILRPGPGVGGHCIAVDPWFLVDGFPEHSHLIHTARQVNLRKTHYVVDQIVAKIRAFSLESVLFLGLSYKPNVDDIRESPSIAVVSYLIERFSQQELQLKVCEPYIGRLPSELQSCEQVRLAELSEVMQSTDLVVILTAHDEFKSLTQELVNHPQTYDTCGLLV